MEFRYGTSDGVRHCGTGLLSIFAAGRGGMDYIIFYIERSVENLKNLQLQVAKY
jgi:hypothetical protein